tara:strand:- start:475 stop:1068 length:594 start_codon:yes stop_codon:yes gene_type:complete
MYKKTKRIFDLIFIIFFSPIIIITTFTVGLIIKLTDLNNDIFYKQERVGKDGKLFTIYKFRTMIKNDNYGTNAVSTSIDDQRITKIGKFLRKHRLDEFPQFFNVLIGDMSIIGPRPEQKVFVEKLSLRLKNYNTRLNVKPGITGLAQIKHGYTSGNIDEEEKKLKYDIKYVNHITFYNDIKILFSSIFVILFGVGSR